MKEIKFRMNEGRTLERIVRSQMGQAALARRARVILVSADRVGVNEIRQRCDIRCIQRWRERFTADRALDCRVSPEDGPRTKVTLGLRIGSCATR